MTQWNFLLVIILLAMGILFFRPGTSIEELSEKSMISEHNYQEYQAK